MPIEVIKPHPYYNDDRQARIEVMIDKGFITREVLEDGNAKYTLTDLGNEIWFLETIHNEFFK